MLERTADGAPQGSSFLSSCLKRCCPSPTRSSNKETMQGKDLIHFGKVESYNQFTTFSIAPQPFHLLEKLAMPMAGVLKSPPGKIYLHLKKSAKNGYGG